MEAVIIILGLFVVLFTLIISNIAVVQQSRGDAEEQDQLQPEGRAEQSGQHGDQAAGGEPDGYQHHRIALDQQEDHGEHEPDERCEHREDPLLSPPEHGGFLIPSIPKIRPDGKRKEDTFCE